MNIGVKLLNAGSNSTRIRNCIEDYVASLHPFDLQIGWALGAINYRYPDKPDDSSTGFIAFDVPGKERLKLKTARYLTRKCKLNEVAVLNDEQIRILAEKINGLLWTVDELNDVELVRGKAITEAYYNEVGGSSCMTGCNSSHTRLYEVNPTRFEMLIIRSNNDSARAIVHKLDNGRKLMGVVYTTAEHLLGMMENYADSQGWLTCNNTNQSNRNFWVMSDLHFCKGEMPYMDVLTEGSVDNGLLTVSHNSGIFELQNTDGYIDCYICIACSDILNEDTAYSDNNGETYCEHCFYEIFLRCKHCAAIVHKEDAIFVEDAEIYVCQGCASDHYYCCEICNEYSTLDNMQIFDNNTYCEGCFDKIANHCEDCGEPFYTKDLTTVGDSGPLCEDCAITRQECEKGAIL